MSLLDRTEPGSIVYVDIDETICTTPGSKHKERDYSKAVPIKSRIDLINNLFDKGREIHYYTSRGVKSGKNWLDVTLRQFKRWGVKFHQISFNKPVFDLFIDDKAINSENIW